MLKFSGQIRIQRTAVLIMFLLGFVLSSSSVVFAVWGGERASSDEYTSVVSIRGDMDCSAVVISSRALLTAGHCVETWKRNRTLIDVSVQSLRGSATPESLSLDGPPRLHPKYRMGFKKNPAQDTQDVQNDLAVILLKDNIKSKLPTATVSPMASYFASQNGVLVGFGRFDRRHQYGTKAFGEMRTRFLSHFNLIEMISVKPRVGGCRGDSGGGFFQTLSNGQSVLVGITSVNTRAHHCGSSDNKTYSVPVYSHICWVTEAAQMSSPNFCETKKGE